MTNRREAKPSWSMVPTAVRREVDRVLGAPVARAVRAYGGYAPSATFRLLYVNPQFEGVTPRSRPKRWRERSSSTFIYPPPVSGTRLALTSQRYRRRRSHGFHRYR